MSAVIVVRFIDFPRSSSFLPMAVFTAKGWTWRYVPNRMGSRLYSNPRWGSLYVNSGEEVEYYPKQGGGLDIVEDFFMAYTKYFSKL
jgi:hypothetical protein